MSRRKSAEQKRTEKIANTLAWVALVEAAVIVAGVVYWDPFAGVCVTIAFMWLFFWLLGSS